MIKSITIRNFKSHKDNKVNFKNLTLLTGLNGSGKSSVIQTLLLLRQSYLKGRLLNGLDLNEPLCNIGIGNDALNRNAKEGIISFILETTHLDLLEFNFNADEINLKSSFLPKKDYNFTYNNDYLDTFSFFNTQFQYLSADRLGGKSDFPKDSYTVETMKQISKEGGKGELVAQFLYKFGSENVMVLDQEELKDAPSLIEQTIIWENKISPKVILNVEESQDGKTFSINYGYVSKGKKPIENLKAENIGFGISYSLPIIVALLSAKPGSLIIIENPEAHIHPEGQLQFASLIAKVASKGVQVVVETHSDHIISGIQLSCKDNNKNALKGINKNLVSINYFKWDIEDGTIIEPIDIELNGSFSFQPEGFFDQTEKSMLKLYTK